MWTKSLGYDTLNYDGCVMVIVIITVLGLILWIIGEFFE